jgi:CheY-like chemotaxis protein
MGLQQSRRQRSQNPGDARIRIRPLGPKERPKARADARRHPYKFGLIGSSDSHTGLAAMEEDNFFGKTTPQEPSPERVLSVFVDNPKSGIKVMDWQVSASGYAAVWARENTRASLWDAMQRRETYATTGSRMVVRFFGGWDFTAQDATSRSPAFTGYTKGVPMVLDINLKQLSGIDVASQLKRIGHSLPVVFITGSDSEATRRAASDAGCIAYLTKPFRLESLVNVIEQRRHSRLGAGPGRRTDPAIK